MLIDALVLSSVPEMNSNLPGTVRRHPGAVPRSRGFAEPTFRKEGVARKGAD